MRKIEISGQTVIVHDRTLYMWLRKGPFLSAGKKYGWNPPVPGLGVNLDILKYASKNDLKLRIFVGDKWDRCYETHPNMFLGFGEPHVEKGIHLRILPWSTTYFVTVSGFLIHPEIQSELRKT